MNTGSALARFTITLSQAVTEPVQVEWFTSDGTAKAGVDYAANKGTVLFAPGETSKTVDILAYGRAVGSEDRSFFVEMLPPTNAILGASIGECIIHVDTTGSTPVTQIIVPTGPQGIQGKSAYQSYLDTTTDNPPMTESEWVESLKGNPAEIALEVAPLIDVGATVLTAEGTETLSKPDSTTVKAVARRVAYAAPAKIATLTLADGDNTIESSDLSGEQIDFYASGFSPRVYNGTQFITPEWSLTEDNKVVIKNATAGNVLYAVQYGFTSANLSREALDARYEKSTLRPDLASADTGKGDELITVKQPLPNSIARSLHLMNADYINIRDWGAKGDGVTDDTAAIDRAAAALAGASLVTFFRRLYVPHGTYIYNGTGIALPNGVGIVGEDLFTTIDASANTNTGYLITLTGFRSRVDTLSLKGNKDNPNMKGVSSYYNTDNGGVVNCIFEDFHYGLDIDKCWYSVYRNIRFRRSSGSVTLTGAHIRIGFNHPTDEVNNLDFSCVWMGEAQKHSVAIYCPTQVLTWNECSFETIGEARIKFYTAANQNTFTLNSCYIEGDVGTGGVYFAEGNNTGQNITCNDCMFRLGSTVGSLGKQITIHLNGGWSNSASVTLNQNNCKVWASGYKNCIGGFADGIDPGRSGDYDGTYMYSAAIYMQPRPQDIRDWNSFIPFTVNNKAFASNGATVDVWKVYIPAGGKAPRVMRLVVDATHKRNSGNEQYNTQWVVAITNADLTGTLLSRVFENGTANAGAGTLTLALTAGGYDATTDATVFTLRLTAATTGNTFLALHGLYADGDTMGVPTKRWRIQRR